MVTRAIEPEETRGPKEPQAERRSLEPGELAKHPEQLHHREVPPDRGIEAELRRRNPTGRVLCLPPVEGFEKSGLMTNQEVRGYLEETFPEQHANNVTLDGVHYRDRFVGSEQAVELGHWQKEQVVEGLNIHHRDIVINPQSPEGNRDREALRDTIAHEVGHQVFREYLRAGDQADWRALSGDRPRPACVSDYAQTSEREDFAESYRAYVRDPEALRRVSSDKYDFLRDRVFAGREYRSAGDGPRR